MARQHNYIVPFKWGQIFCTQRNSSIFNHKQTVNNSVKHCCHDKTTHKKVPHESAGPDIASRVPEKPSKYTQTLTTVTNTQLSLYTVNKTTEIQQDYSLTASEWVSEQCFTSPPTQYRLYGRRFLPARRYASAGYRDRNVTVRPSVCPSVRPSRAGIVSKRIKLAAWFLHHLVAPRL